MVVRLKNALLIADVQNDFCPGGKLGISDGDKIIPAINKYIKEFSKNKLPIFISRDWHPKKTKHFKKFGGVWPAHCVQNTKGAEFHAKLKFPKEAIIISKGMDPEKDSYSAFDAVDSNGCEFDNLLRIFGIKNLFVGGLATDYCVKNSAIDALKKGFKVLLLVDAVKGVNLKPNDSDEAIDEMVRRGARKISFADLKL
ncbi:MAG: nicotinamidase [Candidatus Omnitrophica bacterium CG11_big_fil_rev_8_21_14_0_20_42_13]|uniref:nicotinamidase n=1 Tax=Candidatus Ghiorseimicrobium undicola TaxID=1974746 RepID=A0A2H0LYT3_9BACT|nr:MAG: nicotinamidase [Candidatus Omnitrophica bacterium CG11_big_fil_rev_8_21_14_0_20_42_13]